MENKRNLGWAGSSEDPTKVGDSVKGVLIMFSAIIVIIAGKLHIPITDSNVGLLADEVGLVVGGLWTLYGLLKKGTVKVVGRAVN